MKHPIAAFLLLTFILVAVPVICVRAFEKKLTEVLGDNLYAGEAEVFAPLPAARAESAEGEIPNIPDTGDLNNYGEETVAVFRADIDRVENIGLVEYLCGVLRGEMQPNYEPEALKAQAVAAYTYLVYQTVNNYEAKKAAHRGGCICTDPSHCKAYLSEEAARQSWGDEWYSKYEERIYDAVTDTLHEVLTYDGEVINAVFFSISSGKTEAAENVWGADIPYLVSVDSSCDKEAAGYLSEKTVAVSEYKKLLSDGYGCEFGEDGLLIQNINRSGAGGIISLKTGGVTIGGTDFRMLFGLRSTNIVIKTDGENVHFTVRGYGHGVGMSQYGANRMAAEGASYTEILSHYYPGTAMEAMKVFD